MFYHLHLFEEGSVLNECLLVDGVHCLTSFDRDGRSLGARQNHEAFVDTKRARTLQWLQIVSDLCWLLPLLLLYVIENLDHLEPDDARADFSGGIDVEQVFLASEV